MRRSKSRRVLAMILSVMMAIPQMMQSNASGLNVVKAATVTVPTPVYTNDFESGLGDCTVKGTGTVETVSGSAYHMAYKNGAGGVRSNYLLLPNDVIQKAVGSNAEMTISFDVNMGDISATDSSKYSFYSPIFAAYGAETSNENSWPMMIIQSRGLLQVNCNGYSDFLATDNDKGVNTESTQYLMDQEWHNIAVTFTTSRAVFYVDGVVMNAWNLSGEEGHNISGLLSQEGAALLNYVCLGGNQAWNWNDLDTGYLYDNIKIYGEALTKEQLIFMNCDSLALQTTYLEMNDTYTLVPSATETAVTEVGDGSYNLDLSKVIQGIQPLKGTVSYDTVALENANLTSVTEGVSVNGTVLEGMTANQEVSVIFSYGNAVLVKNFIIRDTNPCAALTVTNEGAEAYTIPSSSKYGSFNITITATGSDSTFVTTDAIQIPESEAYRAVLKESKINENQQLVQTFTITPLTVIEGSQQGEVRIICGVSETTAAYQSSAIEIEDSLLMNYTFDNNLLVDLERTNCDAITNHSYIQDGMVVLQNNTAQNNNYSYLDLSTKGIATALKESARALGVKNAGFTISFDVSPETSSDIGNQNSLFVMKESGADGVSWGFFSITSDGSFQSNKDLGTASTWWWSCDKDNQDGTSAGTWYNVTLIAKNNTVSIYINGILAGTNTVQLKLASATDKEKATYELDHNLTSVNGFIHYLLTASDYDSTYKSFADYSVMRIGQTDIVGNETWMNEPFNGCVDNIRFYQVPLDEENLSSVLATSRISVSEPKDELLGLTLNEVSSLPTSVSKKNENSYSIRVSNLDKSGVITAQTDGTYQVDVSKLISSASPYSAYGVRANLSLNQLTINSEIGVVEGTVIKDLPMNQEVEIVFTYEGVSSSITIHIQTVNPCQDLTAELVGNSKECYEAYEDSFVVKVTAVPKDSALELTDEIAAPEETEAYRLELLSSVKNEDNNVVATYRITPYTTVTNDKIEFSCGTKTATITYSSVLNYVEVSEQEIAKVSQKGEINTVAVHDPSIVASVDADGNVLYAVFGSHMGVATSTDLQKWTSVDQESVNSQLFGVLQEDGQIKAASYEEAFVEGVGSTVLMDSNGVEYTVDFSSFNAAAWNTAVSANDGTDWNVSGNMWAPDVIYNPAMGRWCMYLSLNGNKWNSVIIELVSENEFGPYVYYGPVVYSGFSTSTDKTIGNSYKNSDLELVLGELDALPDKYNKITNNTWGSYWPHAIDPCVFYDEAGNLRMIYGSWSGGIYELELDETNGLRDYKVSYASNYDTLYQKVTTDAYFGIKLAGGYYVSGEGAYIQQIGEYYYLFNSYGFYSPDGGYNVRVFRSKSPEGPFVDTQGNSAIYNSYLMNYNGSVNIGEKLMGNYKWNSMDKAELSQGHNSALVDKDGKAYIVYHTKFYSDTMTDASHAVRVHQLFVNEDGWLVEAPYSYAGETISKSGYNKTELVGAYDLIIHKYKIDYENGEYVTPVTINLNEDGTISGAYTGEWAAVDGTAYVTLTMEGETYKGVFVMQTVDNTKIETMCFTAVGESGLNIWGSKQYDSVVALAKDVADLNLPKATFSGLSLPAIGSNGTKFVWTSSETGILSNEGLLVANPSADYNVVITYIATNGKYRYSGSCSITVHPVQTVTQDVCIGSFFADEVVSLSNHLDGSLHRENPFYWLQNYGYDASNGIRIQFTVKNDVINVLNTILAFLGDGGNNGRLYFTSGSYLGYNAAGSYFDANLKNYGLVTDYMGTSKGKVVDIIFTNSGFEVKIDGVTAYTQAILTTENGAGTMTDYSSLLKWIYQSANQMYFGYGSWWNAAGYDECYSSIQDVKCYVNAVTPSYDTGKTFEVSTTPTVTPTVTPSTTPTEEVTPTVTPIVTPSTTPTEEVTPTVTPSASTDADAGKQIEWRADGTKVVTSQKTTEDGTVIVETVETATDGSVKEITSSKKTDLASKTVVVEEIILLKNSSGKIVSNKKTVTLKNAEGTVLMLYEEELNEKGKTTESKVTFLAELNDTISEGKKITGTLSLTQEMIAAFERCKANEETSIEVKIPNQLVETLFKDSKEKLVQRLILQVNLPEELSTGQTQIVLSNAALSSLKSLEATLTLNVRNLEQDILYTVKLPSELLLNLQSIPEALNLGCLVGGIQDISKVKERKSIERALNQNQLTQDQVALLSMPSSDEYSQGMTVQLPVKDGVPGETVFVYKYNQKTNRLEEIPNFTKKINEGGRISIQAEMGTDYIITNKQLKGTNITTLINQIQVSTEIKKLVVGETTGLKIQMPNTIVLVNKFSKGDPYQKEEAKVKYQVSDKSIAEVSSDGTIKAMKKGTVIVTITILLESGEKKTVQHKIKIQ